MKSSTTSMFPNSLKALSRRRRVIVSPRRPDIFIATQRLHLRILHILELPMLLPFRRARERREVQSRMEDSLANHCQSDHYTLENNELDLDAHQLAAPTTDQFRDAVCAAYEYEQVCSYDRAAEDLEASVGPQCERGLREDVSATIGAVAVFCDEEAEDDEDCLPLALTLVVDVKKTHQQPAK
jgi:hypothetical protein